MKDKIESLFDYAQCFQERGIRKAEFMSHTFWLVKAAQTLIEGFASLEDAEDETLSRFDPWGFEVGPEVISEAVRFLRQIEENKKDLVIIWPKQKRTKETK